MNAVEEGIETLYLTQKHVLKKWHQLLEQTGIEKIETIALSEINQAIGIYDQNRLVATASVSGNILKYVAIDPVYREEGKVFTGLISYLINIQRSKGIYHLLVLTKPEYIKSFEYLGFTCLAQVTEGAILETGTPTITEYLAEIQQYPNKKNAAIVMNANPFTLGHQALIQYAAHRHDHVYVFVLTNEQELFSSQERIELVKKGSEQWGNVDVYSGADYLVSPATFPAYFLRKDSSETEFQTSIDAQLFLNWFVPTLNITTRYLGQEPLSEITAHYNESLKKILTPEITVTIIERKTTMMNQVISASAVRKAYLEGEWSLVSQMVPETTKLFLEKKRSDR